MTLGELLASWGARMEVASVLERAIGPAATPACASLAESGAKVTCVVDDEDVAARMRATYGARAEVLVAGKIDEMPKCDLVIVHGGAPGAGGDWRGPLGALAKHAQKVAVVVAANPGAIDARVKALRSMLSRADGPAWGDTQAIAGVLWDVGRVREHVWLDAPSLAARAPRFTKSLARTHAFVVDVTPRSPQARRKLRLQTQSS